MSRFMSCDPFSCQGWPRTAHDLRHVRTVRRRGHRGRMARIVTVIVIADAGGHELDEKHASGCNY
jgi:hypothetical protein